MDNAILVEELRGILSALRKAQGYIALFMLIASEIDVSAANNLIVSASGYDKVPTKQAMIELVNLLKSQLSESSLKQISRLTVLGTQDPFVKAINRAFNVKNSTVSLQPCNIFGIHIENAVVFESVEEEAAEIMPEDRKGSLDDIIEILKSNPGGLKMTQIAEILGEESWRSLIPVMRKLLDEGEMRKEDPIERQVR